MIYVIIFSSCRQPSFSEFSCSPRLLRTLAMTMVPAPDLVGKFCSHWERRFCRILRTCNLYPMYRLRDGGRHSLSRRVQFWNNWMRIGSVRHRFSCPGPPCRSVSSGSSPRSLHWCHIGPGLRVASLCRLCDRFWDSQEGVAGSFPSFYNLCRIDIE